MVRHALAALLFLGSPAFAGHKSPVSAALSDAKEARELLEDEGGNCGRKAGGKLEDAIEALKDVRDEGGRDAVKEARRSLEKAAEAVDDHCDGKVARRASKLIAHAVEQLPSRRDRDDDREPEARRESGNGLHLHAGGLQLTVGGSTSVSSSSSSSSSSDETNGRLPMSGSAYQSFIAALSANRNEILKKDTAISTLQRSFISARQLGGVLDQFNNEILKMDVAKAARVTDPQNALGLSSKFRNSIYQSEFVEVMNQQN